MPADIVLKNTSDVTQTTVTFTDVTPGTPSAAQTFRLWNDGADPASDMVLRSLVLDGGGAAVRSGDRFVDERWVQIKATGNGSSGSTQAETAWQPVGNKRDLHLDDIGASEYHEIQIRYAPPPSAPVGTVTFYLLAEPGQLSTALDLGHTESDRDGIVLGYGDDSYLQRLIGGDVVESAAPDSDVVIADEVWVHAGIPYSRLLQDETITNLDSAASALIAGEAYWSVLSLGAGTITQTKSAKGTAPLSVTLAPDPPTDEVPLCRVHRDFDAAITDSDITMLSSVGGFDQTNSGLNVTLGPGRALVDNSLVRREGDSTSSLTANETNRVWLLRDGTVSVTITAAIPEQRAMLLYELVTDGSAVTATTDHRAFLGDLIPVEFAFAGALTAGNDAWAIFPGTKTGYVVLPYGLVATVGSNGSTNTTGELRFDIFSSDGDGTDTTIFTSSGTDDRRPRIDWNDTEPSSTSHAEPQPEVLAIPPRSRMRAEIAFPTAYDGTGPSDGHLTVWVAVP